MSAMLELVSDKISSNERNTIVLDEDSLVDENLFNTSNDVGEKEEIKSADITVIDVNETPKQGEVVTYQTKDLITCYSNYLSALSVLPIGTLDELNTKYVAYSNMMKEVSPELLSKLNRELKSEVNSGIYINDDLKSSEYDVLNIMRDIQAFYNFSTALPINTISKLLRSYNEYVSVCVKVNRDDVDNLARAYNEYKKMYNCFSQDVLSSLNMQAVKNDYLDMYLGTFGESVAVTTSIENTSVSEVDNSSTVMEEMTIEEPNEAPVAYESVKKEKKVSAPVLLDDSSVINDFVNNSIDRNEYVISNDVNIKDSCTIVVPNLTSEDFSNLMYSDKTDDMTPDELCSYNGNIICESVKRVMTNMYMEIKKLELLKKTVESSSIYSELFDQDKEYITKYLFAQGNMRLELYAMMEKDLVSGWDKINGDLGATLDPTLSTNKDAYGVYEEAVKCVDKYNNYINVIRSMSVILGEVNKYGFGLQESYLSV